MRVTAVDVLDATEGAGGIPSHALLSGPGSSFPSPDQPHLESCLTGDCSEGPAADSILLWAALLPIGLRLPRP